MSEQQIPKPDFMEDEAWEALMAGRKHESIRENSQAHVKAYLETGGGDDRRLGVSVRQHVANQRERGEGLHQWPGV